MKRVSSFKQGTFCWSELNTTDIEAIKPFYSEIFAWNYLDRKTKDNIQYTIISKDDAYVGAMIKDPNILRPENTEPYWNNYIAVDDIDAMTDKALDLGANLIHKTTKIMEGGTFAMLKAPDGSTFSLWQAINETGASAPKDAVGSITYHELLSNNLDEAKNFYKDLFSWDLKLKEADNVEYYEIISKDNEIVGGMMKMGLHVGPKKSNWMTYIKSDDCERRSNQIEQMGGEIFKSKTEIPGVGCFSVVADPLGTTFGLYEEY